jgi:copper chaperone CopZ
MKKIFAAMVSVLFSVMLHAQFSKANLQASGLTCAMCSNAINKSLQKLPFIETVQADIKNSSFAVTFKSNTEVDIDAIQKAVDDAGFSVAKLKLTGNFDNVAVSNDKHTVIGNRNFHFINVSNQNLQGEQTITIVDKNFLTTKEFKKYSAATKMACIQSGKAASCCTKEEIAAGTRIYHVTI